MLSLSLSSAVRYKHSLARARASEPLKKMSREEKETARFKILKLLLRPNSFSSIIFLVTLATLKKMESGDEKTHTPSFLSVGFLLPRTQKTKLKKQGRRICRTKRTNYNRRVS